MGAWAEGILDDDTALDILDELKELPDPRTRMQQAFDQAVQDGQVEYDDGHAALVSAALIAHVAAGHDLDGLDDLGEQDEDTASWIGGLRQLDFSSLKGAAAAACDKVIHGDSELRELWAENEELFPAWTAQGEAIIAALSSR